MGLVKNVFFLFVLFFLIFSLVKNVFEYQKNIQFYNNYKSALEGEQKKNITLKTQKMQQTSAYEVEKTIRNKLGLLRPGEVSIIIPPLSPSPLPPTPLPIPVYKQWWSVFFSQ